LQVVVVVAVQMVQVRRVLVVAVLVALEPQLALV
jgi:hypothetical protein